MQNMKHIILFVFSLLASLVVADNPDGVWGWPSLTPMKGYVETSFNVINGTKVLAYIDQSYTASTIERAIIQLHGHGRDCWNYARHTSTARTLAAQTMGLDPTTILSIAPEMLAVGDLNSGAFKVSDNYLCWLGDDWSGGYDNVEQCTPGVTGVSAFTAIDAIIGWLQNTDKFPNLNTIVVSGHSLGGQFTHRYASLGNNRGNSAVDVHYWVGNPASYLYLNDERPSNKSALKACDDYNEYKYGLDQIASQQSYASPAPSAAQIWTTYISNKVHLALGLADDGSGDLGCEGLVQGQSHLERGIGYMNFVQAWAGGLPKLHTIDYFPGITHNAGKMLNEPVSLRRLFFDRDSNVTASEDPNGMTNGESVKFVSLTKSSTLQNFTLNTVTDTTLPSRVNLFNQAGNNSSESSTAAQSVSTNSLNKASFNANANGSTIATNPVQLFSSMVFAILVTIAMYF